MKKTILVLAVLLSVNAFAIDMYGVYPTNWWVGMKNPKLQLILHGENAGLFNKVTINFFA